MTKRSAVIYAVSVMALMLVSAVVGYALGQSRQRAFLDAQRRTGEAAVIARSRARFVSSPIVEDAIRRWASKNGGTIDKVMAGYQVQVIDTPISSCVKFAAIAYDVGGEPTYCYQPRTSRLIWENSDVE